MTCYACNKKLQNSDRSLECGQCSTKYHIECLNITREQFVALSLQSRRSWACPSCSNVTRRAKSNLSTPVRQTQVPPIDDSLCTLSDNCLERSDFPLPLLLPTPKTIEDSNVVTMDKISSLLDQKLNNSLTAFMEDFRAVLKEDVKKLVHAEIGATVQELKDDFTTTTNFICEEQSFLKKDIENKSQLIKDLQAENLRVQKELGTLGNRLSSMEKMTRNQNLEIQAVPESRNENTLALFRNLCNTIKLPIEDSQIHSCRRVAKINATSDRPRNILVSLINPRLRDNVLSACQRFNKAHKDDALNTTHLGLPVERRRIYVNEHLSADCKALHAAARKLAAEKKYKFVWVKYGRVYVRKDEVSGCILVKNMDTLNKLV